MNPVRNRKVMNLKHKWNYRLGRGFLPTGVFFNNGNLKVSYF